MNLSTPKIDTYQGTVWSVTDWKLGKRGIQGQRGRCEEMCASVRMSTSS